MQKNKPHFENEVAKWYVDEELTKFATQQQDENTKSLENVMCFAVIGKDISDYVLINDNQEVLLTSHYGVEHSFDTMKTRIVALKVHNHFRSYEKV